MGRRAKALILTGELGSRSRQETDADAKWLLHIGGRPLLDYRVRCLTEARIAEAWIATHSHAHAACAQKYIESLDASSWLHLAVSYNPDVLGLAEAVAANVDLADESDEVIVIYNSSLATLMYGP
jgi:dTDP-glucose pyrophosphorylase